MNTIRHILQEVNNADQMIQGVRDLASAKKKLTHDELESCQKYLSRAIELFREAEDKVLIVITDQISEDLNKTISDSQEVFNWAEEQNDIDYEGAKERSMSCIPRSEY